MISANVVLEEFCVEVAAAKSLWTMRQNRNVAEFIDAKNEGGAGFWSTKERIERYILSSEKLSAYSPMEVPWNTFREAWVGKIIPTGGELGVNWVPSEPQCWARAQEIISGVEEAT